MPFDDGGYPFELVTCETRQGYCRSKGTRLPSTTVGALLQLWPSELGSLVLERETE